MTVRLPDASPPSAPAGAATAAASTSTDTSRIPGVIVSTSRASIVAAGFRLNVTDRPALHPAMIAVSAAEALILEQDRKSTRLNSSHVKISYAVFCLKNKNIKSV